MGGLFRAVLGGAIGAVGGKALKGATGRASVAFDSLLIDALKNPDTAKRVIEAAAPSNFAKVLGSSLIGGAEAAAAKGVSTAIGNAMKDKPAEKKDEKTPEAKKVAAVMDQIKADPYYHVLAQAESKMDPKAQPRDKHGNLLSSAKGLFQFVNGTAKLVGLKDPFDVEQSFEAVKKLTDSNAEIIKSRDPEDLYAAHVLGAGLAKKYLSGAIITDPKDLALVNYFEFEALPNFRHAQKVVSA